MTNAETFSDELKQAIRTFIVKKGRPVKFLGEADNFGRPRVSFYGWPDYDAKRHVDPRYDGCTWEVPEGSFLYEESYDSFQGTLYEGDTSTDGINVSGCRCACGKYPAVTLRWTGTLAELINHLAPRDESKNPKGWTL